jgi:starch phosphorylase
MESDGQFFYHPLENIEDVDIFYEATERKHLTKSIAPERPYTYWTIEMYDQENGFRGGGGLGVLAADTRRIAEKMGVPFVTVVPFYPHESKQIMRDGELVDEHITKDYHDFGFNLVDKVYIKCRGELCPLEVIEKRFKNTRILSITEPNFGELYSDTSGSDHRLYQEVALGFGGYEALKLVGLRPAIIQLNEVATFFAALARLDELANNGMDFYEAVVYTRKHTLYTNHTLVQAAEAEFTFEQFEQYVFPNIQNLAVKKWLTEKFTDGKIKLSSVSIEIAELRSGVSKLHARIANYYDLAGNKVRFKPITNGIDVERWVLPEILDYYRKNEIFDNQDMLMQNFTSKIDRVTYQDVRDFKSVGRRILNETLKTRPDQEGRILNFADDDFIFVFKRRFVDYKRPDLPFRDPLRLRNLLESNNAHYIIAGRIHTGDENMLRKLNHILEVVRKDDYLRDHVHYLYDYDEKLAYGLSVGSNVAINIPIVGLEACGTSWMKDVANMNILISTHDGGVADASNKSYLNVSGVDDHEELNNLLQRMEESIAIWSSDFDLEYMIKLQLTNFLPIISGTRMMKDYLDYLFPV